MFSMLVLFEVFWCLCNQLCTRRVNPVFSCLIYTWEVCTIHDGCKQGIDQQNFNRKSISRKITHPQSWKLQAKLTGEKLKGWSNSREKTNSRLQSKLCYEIWCNAAIQWLLIVVSNVVLQWAKRSMSKNVAVLPHVWKFHCWREIVSVSNVPEWIA